uniref:Uncharacterized protein n=1 Tax=Glossina brevipalpis TaxID=37001 RepID=A0A1A9W4R8_9MUSC
MNYCLWMFLSCLLFTFLSSFIFWFCFCFVKMSQSFRFHYWSLLLYTVCVACTSQEDLMDFDFSNLKEIDWNYDTSSDINNDRNKKPAKIDENLVRFNEEDDLELNENQVNPFDWREKVLRNALSKALTNKSLRQKFVEVMPILRVLSKQQRLALSALISAQINAKKGQELKLEQVRLMFGDDKNLLIPIVYDIANLVRNSAKKYIKFNYDIKDLADFSKPKSSAYTAKRNINLSSAELKEEESNTGILTFHFIKENDDRENDSLEGYLGDVPHDILDPKSINEELQTVDDNNSQDLTPAYEVVTIAAEMTGITDPMDINYELQRQMNSSRRRRSLESRQFVHKLTRAIPISIDGQDFLRTSYGRSLKLNTTIFAQPKDNNQLTSSSIENSKSQETQKGQNEDSKLSLEAYQIIEDLALADLNGTEVEEDVEESDDSLDKATEIEEVVETSNKNSDEVLPKPEELIGGPRYRIRKPIPAKIVVAKRKRVQVRARPKEEPTIILGAVPPPRNCERFTASMCIKTDDYPIDQIMGSIRRHRNAMVALLAEYNEKWNSIDTGEDFDDYTFTKRRREDENTPGGGMCQSIVRYARPQKARSASGEWKYIVNTGQHTQTLRLEKCSNPQESCSYLNQNYRSHCSQVYNYHRLLSWDKNRGLHVDIFKVPTCCSCQVDGYRQKFPPLAGLKQDFGQTYKGELYHDDLDYNSEDDDEDDDFGFSYHKHDSTFDANELLLGSNKVRNKVPSPTVGSYLSPPGKTHYEPKYTFDPQRDTASIIVKPSLVATTSKNNYLREFTRRRPHKSFNEPRADQEYSPSEPHLEREVNIFGTPIAKGDSTHQKRKPIYSVPYIASNSSHSGSTISTSTSRDSWIPSVSPTAITASTGTIHPFIPTSSFTSYQSRIDTNAYQKPSTITTISTSSKTISDRSITAASLPQQYYTTRSTNVRLSDGDVFKPKTRFRLPYTIAPTLTTSKANTISETTTTTSASSIKTTESAKTTSQRPDIYALNPELFNNRHRLKYNISSIQSSTSAPAPKRINYNYHPIIDYFEYNRRVTAQNVISTPHSPISNSGKRTENPIPDNDSTRSHYYAHNTPRAVTVNAYKPKHTERRIGYGADGDSRNVGVLNYINNSEISATSVNPSAGQEVTDIWHPVVVQEF